MRTDMQKAVGTRELNDSEYIAGIVEGTRVDELEGIVIAVLYIVTNVENGSACRIQQDQIVVIARAPQRISPLEGDQIWGIHCDCIRACSPTKVVCIEAV